MRLMNFSSPMIHYLHMYCLFLNPYENLEALLEKIVLIFSVKLILLFDYFNQFSLLLPPCG